MQLVIVESPTKARKLSSYLDKKEYSVSASVGHIRDLPKKGLGIDIEHDFEPTYEVSQDKSKVVSGLRSLAKGADTIILATDPDREGEAIAWHLQHVLTHTASGKKTDVQDSKFKRATFHEITKNAVLDAISHPGQVNGTLVDAQQARRILDRLVGYKVSPVLWKKIRRGLSAGRVQSVALRLIVEREREIEAFTPEEYWELDVAVAVDDEKIAPESIFVEGKVVELLPDGVVVARVVAVEGKTYQPKVEGDVQPVVTMLEHQQTTYRVDSVERKQRKRSSLPPFSTSTLQQQAATRLGMTSKQTMRLAQQLYEEGLITYHRTDSFNLSNDALAMARGYIEQVYGESYLPEKPRVFARSSKNAQEAHEAIRVTDLRKRGDDILRESKKFTQRHVSLYDLIWRRFLASQMETAVYDQTTVEILASAGANAPSAGPRTAGLKVTGSILKFDGWMKLFPAGEDVHLPEVTEKQSLYYQALNAQQKFTQPPPRYNDASLVKELEKRGIGRPSTYASIISVLEDRSYVERESKRFIATSVGMTVNDFLMQHFGTVMDYDFTAEMEEDLDRIARGERQWRAVVKAFYQPLAEKIDEVSEKADRMQIPVEETGVTCPTCGQGQVVIRTGRFGKFKSCSRFPDCDYSENYVEKLEDVACPLCQEGDVIIRKTRWGKPFFGCSRYPTCSWAAWSQPKKGDTITPEEWAEQQAERERRKAARAKGKSTAKRSTKSSKKTKKSTKKKKTS